VITYPENIILRRRPLVALAAAPAFDMCPVWGLHAARIAENSDSDRRDRDYAAAPSRQFATSSIHYPTFNGIALDILPNARRDERRKPQEPPSV